MTLTIATLPPAGSLGGMMILFATLLAIAAVLALPIIFPIAVAATHLIQKRIPSRSSIVICAVVEIILIALTIALGNFLFWASQQ